MKTQDNTGAHAPQPGEENLVRAMAGTAHAMRRYLETTLGDVPGGMSAWAVLRTVHRCGPTTQADLARWMGIAGSTLTRRLDQMEDDELIARADDPEDGRRIIVRLTDKAEQLIAAQHTRMQAETDRLTAGAAAHDLDAVARVIAKIRENLVELGADLHSHDGGRGRGRGRGGLGGGRGTGGRRGRGSRGRGSLGAGDHGDHSAPGDHSENSDDNHNHRPHWRGPREGSE